jgi:hypothetical protein
VADRQPHKSGCSLRILRTCNLPRARSQ